LAGKKKQNKAWRETWFYEWLATNASTYNFEENRPINEAWHWEHTK
jgi:hypothetical protein